MKNGLYPLGKISKTHGYMGVLLVVSDKHIHDDLEEINEIFLIIDGLYVPFPVIEFKLLTDTSAHVKLEFVNNQTDATKLTGCEVFTTFKPNDQEIESVFEKWIGFTVHDSKHGNVGIIQAIEDYKGNIVIRIIEENKEILISFFPELVSRIDEKAKILYIESPDGYF